MTIIETNVKKFELGEKEIKEAIALYLRDYRGANGKNISVQLNVSETLQGIGNNEYPIKTVTALALFEQTSV